MASIVILKSGESISHELDREETIIGRHPECHVQVDSTMVSRKHARILREGSRYFVEDLGSGNGTVVNAQRISDRTPLNHEDRIKLGPVLMRFLNPTAATQRANTNWDRTTAVDAPPLNFTDEADDGANITGTLDVSGSRFGTLDVQPQAKLKAVLEISKSLAGTVELASLLPKILDTLFTVFPTADRGCIVLKDLATGTMVQRATKHRRADEDETVKLSRTIVNRVLEEKTGILSADATADSRFGMSESIANFTIRSMMCVPLLGLDGEPLGLIHIDTQNASRRFQKDDLDLLTAVAGQAALAYETARLIQSYLEKQKSDNEMKIAAEVQRALLPVNLPQADGYQFYASYESAQAVGGDYYDCLTLPDQKVCIAFGDVAGKGVPASLVMSRLSSVVQNTLEFVQDAGAAAERINSHMCANAVEGRFVTFVLGVIDTQAHEMTLVIAGHMSPLIRKPDGTIEEFPDEMVGLPLGVAPGLTFDVVRRAISPGETVVIYTDGVSEAMNPANELYSVERLRELVAKGSSSPAQLGAAILADVRRHAAGRAQNDDITLMVFGREG